MVGFVILAGGLLLLPLAANAIGDPALITLATRMVIYAIAAASLNLLLGYGGLVSFGHAAYFGIGGYVVGILYFHFAAKDMFFGLLPGTNQFLITLFAAMIVSGLAAFVLGALSLRTTGLQFIMITLAFAQMIFFLFISLKIYGGDDGLIIRRRNLLFNLNMADDATYYFVCLAIAALYFGVFWRLVCSRFGLVLGGIRQNERRLAAIGIATYRYKLVAFVIAGIGAGLAGALMANFSKFVSPDMLHWSRSGELMIMVILGGGATLLGPALGAVILVGLETVLTGWTEHWQVILGPILVLVALFTRGGVLSLLQGRSAPDA
ncbi:ABC transporter permease [Bradyrhizobium sp. LTSPM299]|nr:ABC transporter permease [Bradyrhizobium sp. LTSPM299]